jgi:15-cis-phytoene synthase
VPRRITWPSDALHPLVGLGGIEPVYEPVRGSTFDADARYCRELTRKEAANFYWGFVALPRAQRMGIYALYSFARQVDDEVDNVGRDFRSGSDDPTRFHHHRERISRCFAGTAEDPVMRVLCEVVARYKIPRSDLEALIDGVEMDLRVSSYATWDDVRGYCRLVASTIGRMCVHIFGFSDPAAIEYADELGVAMQLANILRDVREDASMGRIYLPLDELVAFGVPETVLTTGQPVKEWESFARFEIERAKDLFERGLRVTQLIPRRAAACVLTMSGIYQAILTEIERDPYLPLKRRASLSGKEKLAVMMRSWLQAG